MVFGELKYRLIKKRVKQFYDSTKLKCVRRALNDDEFFDVIFYKKGDENVI